MRVIVASTVVPFVRGGAELLLDWLAEELRERDHEVEVLRIPFAPDSTAMLPQMVGLRLMDVRDRGDRLIALRTPSYLIRHPAKAVWFLHHHRTAFDLWGTDYQEFPESPEGLGYREMFRAADNAGLTEARVLCCNSRIVRGRLRRFNGLDAEVAYPPVRHPERFHCEEYGDFLFYPSRLASPKRQWLAIKAMARTTTPVRLVLAGAPEPAGYAEQLRTLIREEGVESRVELRAEFISEREKEQLFSRCLALVYIPFEEDSYGYPSLEAHHSRKAVISTLDAGGTDELIVDDRNGFLAEATPEALAARFDQLWEDRAKAERMGSAGADRIEELAISWDHAIARLLA